jgi:oligo-1,6-glucosidase
LNSQQSLIQTCSPSWWKEQIIYQIYPRSFKDTTGNGVGDLRGIIEKLDYIKNLGINSVWINPFYASPNDDNGYDISDYRAILPEFGTMDDFNDLLAGLHDRNIKFVMDLVLNHTSDEHEWFQQSRSSRDNPYRDYYHWWPAEKGKPHHRFSFFDEKGEAWQYDETTDAYYLHYFSKKQPDLNWENPKVRQEIYDVMKFWIDKGVDGFRLDAFQFISKDTSFPKLPDGYDKEITSVIKYHGMGPYLHDYLREMHAEVLSKYKVFAVGEGAGSGIDDAHDLVDEDRKELQMVYHFEAVDMGNHISRRHTLAQFKEIHTRWERAFAKKGWLSIFLANHDSPRMVSKFGDDRPQYRDASAKLLNTFLLTMRGTPYCYFGDELGMTNINFTHIDQYKDIAAINGHKKAQYEEQDMEVFMENLQMFSRDNSRTPMQWDAGQYAGFSKAKPWISVNTNKQSVNVDTQLHDPESVLSHFRQLTSLRANNPLFVYGEYDLLLPDHPQVYMYSRTLGQHFAVVALNFSEHTATATLPIVSEPYQLIVNNASDVEITGQTLNLKPYQAVVLGNSGICATHS